MPVPASRLGGRQVVTLISRRGAGVWTNLPSLSVQRLLSSPQPTSILWVDFGLRYEMLNHFRIPPALFPERSCLLGLRNALRTSGLNADDIVTYDRALHWSSAVSTPSSPESVENIADPGYSAFIANLAGSNRRIFMVPLQVPQAVADATAAQLSVHDIEATITQVINVVQPTWIVLTCEGQPEAHLFGEKLGDETVRWCLDNATVIVSLVRHDSEERFRDGIAIPTILSTNPTWRDRLRVVLTRASPPIQVSPQFSEVVLGFLPFADFVGESVSAGRIPLVDILCRDSQGPISAAEREYTARLTGISERMFNLQSLS